MTATRLLPEDLGTSFVPRFRPQVATIPVVGEAVLYEEDTGELHRLDAIGAIVCSLFDGQTTVETAVAELVDAFGAPRETITADVLGMVRVLGEKGLLDGVHATADAASEAVDDGC